MNVIMKGKTKRTRENGIDDDTYADIRGELANGYGAEATDQTLSVRGWLAC